MKYRVSLVVEVDIPDITEDAVSEVEARVQEVFDRHAKRLNAVVGADYDTVVEKSK